MEKYVPVVVIKELSETDKILTALKNNGINTAEITFRTACAAEAIAYACKNYPDMNVGAGTGINAEQCEAARAAGCSTSNFCRTFKTIVGESFHKRLNRHRISCALGLLRESSMQISDIAAEVGFPEAKSFCRVFRDIMGMTPGEYRRMP